MPMPVVASVPASTIAHPVAQGPFAPGPNAVDGYRRWRDAKLAARPVDAAALVVAIADPTAVTAAERAALLARCRAANMAIYALPPGVAFDADGLRAFARGFGLTRLDSNMLADDDGISPIAVAGPGTGGAPGERQRTRTRYIPYTDRPIAWHTDGYYNAPDRQVRGMVLHCVRPAAEGGENALLDPELVYIRLREDNPEWVAALMRADAMTIPANAEPGQPPRPDQSGPVFSVDSQGALHMRYTHRTRSIAWHPDAAAAAARLRQMLDDSDAPFVCRHRLTAGQGLVCNNVLHTREGFADDPVRPRLLYRARYLDRVGS